MNAEIGNTFDAAAVVIKAMRSVGVAPIPRNYHLFYEAYVGSKTALAEKLAMLGSNPTQPELDELAATEMTATPPASLARRSCSFSRS
jgi:diguanylate cyclase